MTSNTNQRKDLRRAIALPMYNWPELNRAHQSFGQVLSNAFPPFDCRLGLELQDEPTALIHRSKLLFMQTCGQPLVTKLKGKALAFAAPHYAVEGCGPGLYQSAILVRKDDKAQSLTDTNGYKLAFNSLGSQSGYVSLAHDLWTQGHEPGFFSTAMRTGSHRASLKALAAGKADICALDALCWTLVQDYEPEAVAQVRLIGWTKPRPAMPYVTPINQTDLSLKECRQSLQSAFAALNRSDRQALRLEAIIPASNQDFAQIAEETAAISDFNMVLPSTIQRLEP